MTVISCQGLGESISISSMTEGRAFSNLKEGLVKEDRKELRGGSGHNYRYVFLIQSVSEEGGGPEGAGSSGAQ